MLTPDERSVFRNFENGPNFEKRNAQQKEGLFTCRCLADEPSFIHLQMGLSVISILGDSLP
jgi:hypothetical protein